MVDLPAILGWNWAVRALQAGAVGVEELQSFCTVLELPEDLLIFLMYLYYMVSCT